MGTTELLLERHSCGPEATQALGREIGALLQEGEGVALRGELGAGKTVFVRGMAEGLGVEEPSEVRSPTYLLMVEHPGRIPLLHLDAYFAQRGGDFLADGGQAYLEEAGVVAVEWADRLGKEVPGDFLIVELEHRGESERWIRFLGDPELWRERLGPLGA